MADPPPLPGIDRAAVVRDVGDWLVARCGATPLERGELARRRAKVFVAGWRLRDVETAVGRVTIDVLLDDRFPRSPPRLAWVDAPPFPSIPHVEADGLFCALSSRDSIDPSDPIALTTRGLGAVAEILEEGLAGRNLDDFRTEFASYWVPGTDGPDITSLLDPCGPTRPITAWGTKKGMLVAEDAQAARSWLVGAIGKKNVAPAMLKRGVMLWMPAPLLPAEYPDSIADLRDIAAGLGPAEADLLDSLIARGAQDTVVVLGAPSGDGAVFGGVVVGNGRRPQRRSGFRPARMPAPAPLGARSAERLLRSRVERADRWWVHGRDGNADLVDLAVARVAIVGCGSLGAPVARLLAAAGVGEMLLIDPETLTRANTGRHPLGAGSVGRHKSSALRLRLERDFPHLIFECRTDAWQTVARDEPEALHRRDLVISTLGSWNDEAALNDLQIAVGLPPVVYGWAEPRGVAGQAVAIGRGAGCLACGTDTHGEPVVAVAAFDRPTLRRETACGAFFQPYGAVEIEAVACLVADLALDLLLERAEPGTNRLLAAPATRVNAVGGRLTAAFVELSDGRRAGGNQEERRWAPRADCAACGGAGA